MKQPKNESYHGFQRAGIRLSKDPLPDIVTHSSENELPLLYACHMFDKAHLVMLAEESIIPRKDAALMLAALRDMEQDGIEKVRLEVGGGVHSGEHYLINTLSEDIGGRIHLGRSSGDLDKVAERIKQRDELLNLMDAVNEFREVVLKVAGVNVETVMPGYTHGQHAQPTTFGHYLLAWAAVLSRDFQRLESVFHRVNRSPAGAAIMTGTNFPVNRHRTAELLGFENPSENTLDAIHNTDDLIEVFSMVALLHTSIAKWAEDLILWSGNEIKMVELPDRFCGTSSILVQKKNPYALEHIRGAAAETVGGLMTSFFGEKGPTGLSVFSRKFHSYQALSRSLGNLLRDLRWMTGLVPALKLDKALMGQRAGAFWAQATDIAGAMVRDKGCSWRTAHQISGILVRRCLERGVKPHEVTGAMLDEASVEYMGEPIGISEESLRKSLDPLEFVRGRTLYGGPAPEESRKRIEAHSGNLERDREAVAEMRRHIEEAGGKLERAIDDIIDSTTNRSDSG
ncbi:MAG: argininosuccinate lyase [Deltaproteobacteria bacterium]|nr:argininosuccinate lyase [Deltaproteobacteria bacterium]